MCCKVFLLAFLCYIMNISDGLNFSVFYTTESVKYKSLSIKPLEKISQIACGFQCERYKCCGASYDTSLQKCYLHQSCCGDVENATGWKILQKDIVLKMIYITQMKSWDDAQAHCVSLGGRLAVIDTAEKHDLILCLGYGIDPTWIGASDRDEEGKWLWQNPIQPVLLDYWASGEPNNVLGAQHCMTYRSSKWDDAECPNTKKFICDIP